MTEFNGFRGAAKPLDDIDLPRIGYRIKVGEDEIHAVMDVEAAGGAWDAQKRPKMLFEPHRFYRNLGPGAARDRAVAEGLAYPTWGEQPYPKDSYPRLARAMEIDETAALKSASWGLGQILGENFAMVGYPSVQAFVLAMLDDAETHLEAMVQFIIAAHLDDELRAHNWAAFARGYNGPQYAKNGYHTKLKAAFAKWAGIKDTPWSPEIAAPALVQSAPASEPIVLPALIGHNGGPALEVGAPVPVPAVPAPNLTPVEQMNKPVKGAQAGAASMTAGGAVVILMGSIGWLPSAWMEGAPAIAVGVLASGISTLVGSFIGAYLARDKRYQPKVSA